MTSKKKTLAADSPDSNYFHAKYSENKKAPPGAEDVDAKPCKWHDKCVAGYEMGTAKKKKIRKGPKKIYPDEVVRFVEGCKKPPEQDCETSRKPLCGTKRRSPRYSTEVRFLEHKYIQCNITRGNEDAEVFLPEEIKPLLINVTFLLHELKPQSESKNHKLFNTISKITTLLMELSRRPIKKFDEGCDGVKPFDEIAEKLATVLKEHSGPNDEKYEHLVEEVKYLEQELIRKDSEVNYVKEQIREERERLMSDSKNLSDILRNSILKNESLKAEIKYNKAQFRKFSKILAQKEQLKQKSLLELNNLRRKCAKMEQSVRQGTKPALLRLAHPDTDVIHGGSVTKYIKSKIAKDNKAKKKIIKRKPRPTSTVIHEKPNT